MQDLYIQRINKVLTYIDAHLDGDLSLEIVAQVGCYSPYHLHRLFKAITHEPLNAYITRKRIERAALLLIHQPELSIAQIALKYGFKNDSTFSKTFKKIYQTSPTNFRKAHQGNMSKIGQVNSKIGQQDYLTPEYLCNINHLKNWIKMNAEIQIVTMPDRYLAYLTHIGVDALEESFEKIIQWALPKGLLDQQDTYVCRVFHDSFKITDPAKVRMSIGIAAHHKMPAQGLVQQTSWPGGRTLVARFTIEPPEFEASWNSLFIWMSEKGYQKADRNPFEIYHNNFNEHPEQKCIVDLCIPIE
ncbi:MAG: AraC family transcriptional regulator [Flavobacteriaceae bacterium]